MGSIIPFITQPTRGVFVAPNKTSRRWTLDLESDQCCWLNRFIKKPPSRNQTQQKLISLDISWSNAMCSCTIYPWYMLILDKAIQWWSPDSATSTSTTHQNGTKAKHTFTHQSTQKLQSLYLDVPEIVQALCNRVTAQTYIWVTTQLLYS